MTGKEVIDELIENLYFSMNPTHPKGGKLNVCDKAKLARAYAIAEQLYEYDIADRDEVEQFVNNVTGVTE